MTDVPTLSGLDPRALTATILDETESASGIRVTLPDAIELATLIHAHDVRKVGQTYEAYIAHPLRNALRLIRLGCRDDAILSATVLHDTVEDHAPELAALGGENPTQVEDQWARALDYLSARFGRDVARMVAAVSNPPRREDQDATARNLAYAAHVEEGIRDPDVLLVKFSDFVDNAGSLEGMADTDRRVRLARKYSPLVPVFRNALATERDRLRVSRTGPEQMVHLLDSIASSLEVAVGSAHP